ncbi:mechanosensitive ion channel family protein [Ekhidna sp.]|uniref:mechanosensitive ion channel family protein n=1 Tax=Ekhidna sp. TaxID=2608089 RepID=UPI003CCB7898
MLNKVEEAFQNIYQSIYENAPDIIIGIILFILFLFIGYAIKMLVVIRLKKRSNDQLLVNFIGRIVFFTFFIFASVLFLNQIGLGKAAGGLLAGAGVSAIIIGFAFKDIGENFLAGFFLAFGRPFNIGDVIEVNGLMGKVKALNFRNTHIRTFDGKDIYIPNAMLLKNPLQNYTGDGLLRYNFIVGVDYNEDLAKVSKIIQEALAKNERILQGGELAPFIQLEGFGTNTIDFNVFYWVDSKNFLGVIAEIRTTVMHGVIDSLREADINLPANIVEVKAYDKSSRFPLEISKEEAT